MNLEQYAYIAEIVASIAVVASLVFVALEIRKNTRQSEIANWNALVDRFNAVYLQTNDMQLANLVAKGRHSYRVLTDGEKISFGHYLEQLCIANEGSLVMAEDVVHSRDENLELFGKHIGYHLGFKGSREWYKEFSRVRGFPPKLATAINDALEQQ